MRYALLAAILVIGLATAGSVSAQELIGVSGFTAAHGMLGGSGTLGGVDGSITSTVTAGDADCANSCSGNWTMIVGNANFAGGTFTCDDGSCLYLGNAAVATPTGFAISTVDSNVGTNIAAAIYRHGMWVNDVNAWAVTHPSVIAAMNMSVADFIAHATADNGTSE
ncbi:MAG TPA: hypothetical protein VGX75_10705 [bacterium]|nr:hypothetical protein [bacterium]